MEKQYVVFTKPLQWLDPERLARVVSESGFDGVDLSVRPGGHVEPASVDTDLPRVVETLAAKGVSCPTIVTGITAVTEESEAVVKAAASCGVEAYRMGYLDYGTSVDESLVSHRATFEQLAELNTRHGIHGAYQNHAGTRVGSPVWDLYPLLDGLPPDAIGFQYDVRHAVIESGSGWELGMRRLAKWIRTIVAKDGYWVRTEDGRFEAVSCPVGTGMVDWDRFNKLLPETDWNGIVSVHFEFPLFPEDPASLTETERTQKTIDAMRAELERVKARV